MKKIIAPAVVSALLFSVSLSSYAQVTTDGVYELSTRFEPAAVRFAEQQGAQFLPTADGRCFVLWWQPEGFDAGSGTVLASLPGHEGWAAKDFMVWFPHIKDRGYAFLGIQYWFGRSAQPSGYAKPDAIYAWTRAALEAKGIAPGHVIFTGFSMGGANSYAVTYLDRLAKPPYFAITISNAGAMETDYPPNSAFLDTSRDPRPFEGAHWVLYCAEHDKQRATSCDKMEITKTVLEERGAVVEKFIRDPRNGHGGFMQPANHVPVLDLADKIVQSRLKS